MKRIFLRKTLFFLFAATVISCSAAPVSENDKLKIITRLTGTLLSKQHYRQQPLDQKMSGLIFDAYFKMLDPGKIYFTAEDIRLFEPQRNLLSMALNEGNTDFAFAVYKVFKKRFYQYNSFAADRLKHPFDFSGDEEFIPDRRKMDYPANDTELQKVWLQKLKNDLLYFRLIKRSLESGTDKKDKSKDEKEQIRALWETKTPGDKLLRRLKDLKNYYDQRDSIDILSLYLGAVSYVYGPHTGYLPPKIDEDFEINMSLSLTGIGATLTSDSGYIRVVDIVPGGPAALDGRLHPEDRIIAVTQEKGEPVDVIDMSVDNAVKMIRGPIGSKVTLTILPGKKGRNAVPENIAITRDKVMLKDSEARGDIKTIQRNGKELKIGIITLPGFYMDFAAAFRGDPNYKSCTRDVKKILEDFKTRNVDAVLMDLRNNGGGSLPEAITLTGLFIKSGPVVQVRQANRRTDVESDEDDSITWSGPLAVLANKLSASATEIFAGAIQDYRRGVIIGDSRTFGKGTVLSIIQLERMLGYINRKFPAGSLRLETAMFFRINGNSVQQLGITPDIVLPSLTEQLEIGEMFSDNHLPWDQIKGQTYQLFDPELPAKVTKLDKSSKARINATPEYQKLIKRISRVKEQIEKKKISLNEEKRWKEYISEKELMDAEDRLDGESARNKKRDSDPLLAETVQITGDLAEMNRK